MEKNGNISLEKMKLGDMKKMIENDKKPVIQESEHNYIVIFSNSASTVSSYLMFFGYWIVHQERNT